MSSKHVESYRDRLLALEASLSARIARERERARTRVEDSPADIGDASVADEDESETFSEAELAEAVLQQVRDALQRIDRGTFGRCVVDGGPIDEKRLQAVPWTPYCLKHQKLLEAASRPMPTL